MAIKMQSSLPQTNLHLQSQPSTNSFHSLQVQPKSRNLKTFCSHPIKHAGNETINDSSGNTETLRVVFVAGGTGGHLFPAIAIADELKAQKPETQILFVGTSEGMESTAVPSASYHFATFPAPLAYPFFSLYNCFILPSVLINSIRKSLKILQEFKPHIVVGTGGFVSLPTCLAAIMRGQLLVIQEQNSVPGITNRVLSVFADRVFVAFNSSVECFWQKGKCVVCGNPVRLSLMNSVSKAVAREYFFPEERFGEGNERVILVLGGSLGANALNIALLRLYHQLFIERQELYLIWQTGVEAFGEMESLVREHPRLILAPFLHSMDMAYAAADLVISRAGAMTCYEILATGKPCLLIPSSIVAEGHQSINASLMADLAGSSVIPEEELDSTTLKTAIDNILDNEKLMVEMSERAQKAAKTKASSEIAEHLISLFNTLTANKRN